MNSSFRLLLAVAISTGTGLLLAPAAHAQRTDSTSTVKPQLNTAPPGTAPRPATPAPAPAPAPRPQEQQVPVPAPAPASAPAPAPQPSQDSPSGLDFPAGSRASEQPKPLRRYFLYSNFGLGFNSIYGLTQFNASVAPALGIRLTKRLAVGPGVSYAYSSYAFRGGSSIRTNSYGVKGFAQFIVYEQFFVHAEYEVTNAEVLFQDPTTNVLFPGKLTVRTPLAGAGYRQQFGERFAGDIVLLYNFNDGINDIYGQPVIRFSFLYNLK